MKVGTPVARRPPRRPLHAVFAHRAPQVQCAVQIPAIPFEGERLLATTDCCLPHLLFSPRSWLKRHFTLLRIHGSPALRHVWTQDLLVSVPVLEELLPRVAAALTPAVEPAAPKGHHPSMKSRGCGKITTRFGSLRTRKDSGRMMRALAGWPSVKLAKQQRWWGTN